jgi:hypothetical protein
MAQGIQDIGNGLGLIYVIAPNGTTILATQPNTVDGVRQVRSLGASSAPISAQRPAIGTINITSVTGASNVVGVVINGVNQIVAPVAGTVGNVTLTAFDIADAINSFVPGSGPNYTAQASGSTVFIFSPPADGVAVNNSVITVSTSNGNITRTVTPLTNGANGSGAFDSVVGLRFALNANYTNPVVSTTIVGAIDITSHIVVRGMQSGTPIVTGAITSDAIPVVNRYSTIQELQVATQGGAPTDYLGYINPFEFSPGDTIRLRSSNLAQVTTVVDVSDLTPLSTFQRNIYLCNQASFELASNRCIVLTLVYDSTAGLIWVEDTRAFSSSSSIITTTRAALLATLSAGLSTAGQQYLVTDIPGAFGVVCEAISATEIKLSCDIIALVPDYQNTSGNFGGTWYPQLAAATINKWYVLNGVMYRNTTGAVIVNTPPTVDTVNWTQVPLSSGFYITEIHYGEISLATGVITYRKDKRNNVVIAAANPGSLINYNGMCWGNANVRDNVNNNCDLINLSTYAGALMVGNVFKNNATLSYSSDPTLVGYFYGTPNMTFKYNVLDNAIIHDVYADEISYCTLNRAAVIENIGLFNISANFSLNHFTLQPLVEFRCVNFVFALAVINCEIGASSTCNVSDSGTAFGQMFLLNVNISSDVNMYVDVTGFNSITDVLILPRQTNFAIKFILDNSMVRNSTIQTTPSFDISLKNTTLGGFNFDKVFFNTGDIFSKSLQQGFIYDTLNLDDPAIYSGTTLTLPAGYSGTGGTFLLTSSSPTITINSINNLLGKDGVTMFEPLIGYDNLAIWRFVADDGLTVTFNSTPALTVSSAGSYVSDSASDVIVGRNITFSAVDIDLCDYLEVYGVVLAPGPCVRKNVLNKLV